jgi:phosphoglycerol transferase MdoB-like AlkP superfamily enzyme
MNLSSLFLISTAYALPRISGLEDSSGNIQAYALLNKIICPGAQWLFFIAILLSIVFALLAAFQYMTSSGDPAKVKSATQSLIFTAVGVAVALIAFLFPSIVAGIIGTTVGSPC